MSCIILNVIEMALIYDDMPDGLHFVLDEFNLVFTIIFLIEIALKVISLGFKNYW